MRGRSVFCELNRVIEAVHSIARAAGCRHSGRSGRHSATTLANARWHASGDWRGAARIRLTSARGGCRRSGSWPSHPEIHALTMPVMPPSDPLLKLIVAPRTSAARDGLLDRADS
jgi:hypothetical protein